MIPSELKKLPQWCCSVRENRKPINPATKKLASVTDPKTWGTYKQATEAGFSNVGFVLTADDPYTLIDIDAPKTPEQKERNSKVLKLFESYAEVSASGKGAHILIKGKVPRGTHYDQIGIFSEKRYVVCTGKQLNKLPIKNQQELLTTLFSEQTKHKEISKENYLDRPSSQSDQKILERALSATNADKFNKLCNGKWQNDYPSQSEADFALISILSFYTPSNPQVKRLFRMSALGKRTKATKNDYYIDLALKRIRVPDVKIELPKKVPPAPPMSWPPGLVGEIAKYIFKSAVRPVREIAITAAIALMAGICGRSYNISSTGLNQYLILLATTGSGKEGAASGIEAIIAELRKKLPTVDTFIGPAAFASGQSLIRALDAQPVFVSILGEFGLTLQQLCDPKSNSAVVMLKKVLLDLYSKSGWKKILHPSVYSDSAKNTKLIHAPCISILGESTPETFYDGLDQSHITEGLLPRFSIIEYTGGRPARNLKAFSAPPENLIEKLTEIATIALTTQQNNTNIEIDESVPALNLLDAFDVFADKKINESKQDTEKQLWNRAHLQSLKISGLLSIGNSPHKPCVSTSEAKWAVTFIAENIQTALKRFRSGTFGTGDHRQAEEVKRIIETYSALKPDERRKSYIAIPKILAERPNIVPYNYIRKRAQTLKAFKNDRSGATVALTRCLNDMIRAEIIDQTSPVPFNLKTDLYIRGKAWFS